MALASAAVIEPQPLAPKAAAGYLRRCLPQDPGRDWEQVLKRLESRTRRAGKTPLAETVKTPLGLWLLRITYIGSVTDSTLLLNPKEFPTTAALRAHLFDRLIPTLITRRPPSNDPAELFRPRRTHDPDKVRDWLGYLAHHLNQIPTESGQTGTRDFAWWRLAATTHAITRTTQLTLALLTTLTVGLAIGLVAGLAVGFVAGPATGLSVGLVNGLSGGSAVGLTVGLGAMSWARHSRGHADLRIRQRSAELVRKLAFGLVLGLAFGLVLGLALVLASGRAGGLMTQLMYGVGGGLVGGLMGKLVLGLMTNYGHTFRLTVGSVGGLVLVVGLVTQLMGGPVTRLIYGLALGLVIGLAVGFVAWVETPAQVHHATTPMGSWYTDRTLNLVRISTNALAAGLAGGLVNGLVVGLGGAPAAGLAGGLVNGLVAGVAGALIYGLAYGLAVGLGFGKHRAWLAYLVATWRLARADLLPRRLMLFLDDCHRLGLLRAVGPIYQFRHAELQDHLAATYRSHEQAGKR